MKIRRSYIVFDLLAALSFAGAYYSRVFAKKKLGFVRWLNFNGTKLTESIPVDRVRIIAAAAILLIVVAVLSVALKRRSEAGFNGIVMCAAMVVAALFTVNATMKFDYEYSQAYFLIIPVLWLGTLFLCIRNLIPPAREDIAGKHTQNDNK
jgi:hypothetical protein